MAEDSTPAVYRLNPSAVDWRLADGEVVALDLVNSRYLAVNRSGARLWPLLVEGATSDDLQTCLVDRYGLSPATAEADTRKFLQWLEEAGLVSAVTE
jgi:hypothetical protein